MTTETARDVGPGNAGEVARESGKAAATSPAPRVLGIDPSLTATGLANADGSTFTIPYRRDEQGDLRLVALHEWLTLAITGTLGGLTLAVVEDLPTHAHGAGKTGMAQGVIRLVLAYQDVPYITVTAATVKKYATGKGNATKPDMRMALYQRAGLDLRDDNQVDAWWLRALGCHLLGRPLLQLPKTHLDALDKVDFAQRAQVPA